jgi:hypothetical protein
MAALLGPRMAAVTATATVVGLGGQGGGDVPGVGSPCGSEQQHGGGQQWHEHDEERVVEAG